MREEERCSHLERETLMFRVFQSCYMVKYIERPKEKLLNISLRNSNKKYLIC